MASQVNGRGRCPERVPRPECGYVGTLGNLGSSEKRHNHANIAKEYEKGLLGNLPKKVETRVWATLHCEEG